MQIYFTFKLLNNVPQYYHATAIQPFPYERTFRLQPSLMFCVSPMNWKAGLVHCKYSQCLISTDAPLQGKGCQSPGCVPLNVPFLCLQRRLREAVQLLEDYKHGTLRPGITNEQVTLLEVGRERKVANSPPTPCSQNHFSSLQNPLLLLLHPLWTSGFFEGIFKSLL